MSRILILIYAVACYLAGNLAILYAIAFVGDFAFVTHTVNRGAASSLPVAIVIDLILLGLFAVQHSVMARPAFKRMWTRIVPPAAERATYVLLAGVALGLLYLFWRPIPGTIWTVTMPAARIALWVVFWAGWATLLVSTFLIDHFELFGLSQAFAKGDGAVTTFKTPGLYKLVRHPIYLGLLLAFWAAPSMSASRLLFAVGATGYILVGIWFEERDLIATFGDRYRDYRKRVSMLLPWPPAPETKP